MKAKLKLVPVLAILAVLALAPTAFAGSVENMERERSIMLQSMLDPNMSQQERHKKVDLSRRRLVDLERIVLRDKSLTGRGTPAIKRAFANYDLTFLVHSATEKSLTVTDHWFEQLSLTSKSLMVSTRRRR